jgi:hypothetical protein
VLEHIENDYEALQQMAKILKEGRSGGPKRLIIFVPAHAWAYGSMDRSFGHFRRYSKRSLMKLCMQIAPESKMNFQYFNLFGLPGWFINGRVLKRPNIGSGAIYAFERLCRVLRPIDDVLHQQLKLPLGQSLIGVLEWT